MGTVAADGKQGLDGRLVHVRNLIEERRFEQALDRLDSARVEAEARGDAPMLGAVHRLALSVWRHSPRGSETTERADRLVRASIGLGETCPSIQAIAPTSTKPRVGSQQSADRWRLRALGLGFVIWLGSGVAPLIARGDLLACLFEKRVGWPEEAGAPITTGVIGLVLWVMAASAARRRPDQQRLIIRAYAVVYIVALIIFFTAIAPAIWGSPGCAPSGDTWDFF